jgi:hypothetical protein
MDDSSRFSGIGVPFFQAITCITRAAASLHEPWLC